MLRITGTLRKSSGVPYMSLPSSALMASSIDGLRLKAVCPSGVGPRVSCTYCAFLSSLLALDLSAPVSSTSFQLERLNILKRVFLTAVLASP